MELYSRTSAAIDELLELRKLVEQQVGFLMKKLSNATDNWKKGLYKAPFKDAPKVVRTNVGNDGTLVFDAEIQGTTVGAQHISNESDLRATLLGFLLAFWEYLLNERGGLPLLLLDDLQELFDRYNRRRIANNIAKMVEGDGQVIVTTNDHHFGRRAANSVYNKLGGDKIDRRYIHPLVENREHIELGYFTEEIEKKRKLFEEKKNEHQVARDYIKQLRNYIENRLIDLFDVSNPKLPKKPALSNLMDAIRTRRNAGNEPFTGKVFEKLLSGCTLASENDFMNLINESHHGNEDQIMYNDVWDVKDKCTHVQKLVETVHEEYERWLQREPGEIVLDLPTIPTSIAPPSFSAPMIENLAAFTTETAPGEVTEAYEVFDGSLLADHGIYLINTHNFGFAGAMNCRAIVKMSQGPVPDHSLVIGLYRDKVYARRFLRDDTKPEIIVLASEAENPKKRAPSLFLPLEEVSLLQVVGLIFDYGTHWPKTTEEAVLLDNWGLLEKVEIVFKDIFRG
jgi:hypothetical protein